MGYTFAVTVSVTTERTPFPSADKGSGTASDYRTAVMGSSTHYGTISVDAREMTLTFHIQDSSFPNWKGESQKRQSTVTDSALSYFGVPRSNGDVPLSVWKRVQ
ncbi:MAG TPA: lipocalin-like domain-containing protein [Paraburkholderia sp.]|nr:lipocalin-like domain-containing protein [Paraburkholderia sp.]